MMRYFVFPFLCLFFMLTWPACSSKTGSSQDVVIRVGDRSITLGDIEGIVNITALENGVPSREVWSSINSLVGRIVDNSLLLEYGRDMGITLSELELEKAIQGIVKDYPEGRFEETLLTNCIDYDAWKERLREKLLIKKVVEKKSESLAPIPYHAIKAYYEERKEDFRHPPRAKLIHLITRTSSEAQAVLTRFKGGEDMARIVNEQSISSGIQGDCGINWTTKDMLPPPISNILFSIPVGELSSIIETPYGFHIIKVLQREPAGIKELFEVRGEIENRLLSEAIERHYRAWLSQLRNQYPVTVNYTLLDRIRTGNERS